MTDLASVKSQFILNPQINYLNHGSFGACPKPVFEDYQKWQRMLENDPYQFMLKTGQEYLKASKKALADYINCDQEDLVYVPNPSMAMNIVIKNLDLQEGDEILTSNQEYGAIDRTWNYHCKKTGAKYVRQEIKLPIISKEEILKQFWSGHSERTRFVFLSEITSPTGLIFPVKEICTRAKELGLMTIIDGAHVPGHIPLNLEEMEADIYTGAVHKWMLAPKGNSFLFVKKEFQDQMDPLIVSWGYEPIDPKESQFQEYHQYNGTRDFSAYLTTPAAIQFMEENQWEERKAICRKQLKHYYPIVAKELNSEVICPVTDEFLGQLCSIPIQSPDWLKLKEVLYDEYKIEIPITHTEKGMFLRISFQAYNGEAGIEDLLDAIKKIKASTNLLS